MSKTVGLPLIVLPLIFSVAYAAHPVDLAQVPVSYLHRFAAHANDIKEDSRTRDFNHTEHVRFHQTFQGYPVWGANGVMHNGKAMSGRLYERIAQDLPAKPIESQDKNKTLIVYVDKNQQAHWAYKIMDAKSLRYRYQRPVLIVDAYDFDVYEHWDDVQTLGKVSGGGMGGNVRQGELVFDGGPGHLPALTMSRRKKRCYLRNSLFKIVDYRHRNKLMKFKCRKPDATHNNTYWFDKDDAVNGAYSPAMDALYGASVVEKMFGDWYQMAPLTKNGKPMRLPIIVHHPKANASWSNNTVTLGDSIGSERFYPFTSLDVVGHEIGHGVTRQHSNLIYNQQSGGLNEAFSDMSAMAVEYYEFGKASWRVGYKFMRDPHKSLRYMDKPSKDCYGKEPGDNCSIDHLSQYYDGLNVHKSSGIYNHIYYLISTAPGWNPRRAYNVMLQANMFYWIPKTTFNEAACGVLKAAADYHYDASAIQRAFDVVGVDYHSC